jgi:hypothetical protein
MAIDSHGVTNSLLRHLSKTCWAFYLGFLAFIFSLTQQRLTGKANPTKPTRGWSTMWNGRETMMIRFVALILAIESCVSSSAVTAPASTAVYKKLGVYQPRSDVRDIVRWTMHACVAMHAQNRLHDEDVQIIYDPSL